MRETAIYPGPPRVDQERICERKGRIPGAPDHLGRPGMSVLGMLAWFAAAASCWLGARRHESAVARGYRWLAGAALLYCTGLVLAQVLGDTLTPTSGLSFADLPSLLALASAA